jgi:DNA polymerase-3 subunit alpha
MSHVPLHNHSEYSSLDGLASFREIAARCLEIGCPCCGITDHGTVAGHLEADKVLRKAGVKPIFGCELYMGTKTEFGKNERDQAHFIALAMTDEGLRNLWRMVDAASDPKNYRYVGRINLDICERHKEGIVATSACIQSVIGQSIMKENYGDPWKWTDKLLNIYGDNLYIELHTYPGQEHEYLNNCLVEIAHTKGIGLVYATDAHRARKEDYPAFDAYVAMSTGDNIYMDPQDRKMWHPENSLYIMDEDEVREALSYLPPSAVDEAIANTVTIGERADAHLPGIQRHLPAFIPANCPWLDEKYKPSTAAEVFIDLVEAGIQYRYGDDDVAWDRAIREMEVYLGTDVGVEEPGGLGHYFLQAWDFCQFCDAEGIQRGPGRGSAAGSIVSYALGITDVDPLHYDLIFERFWNPGRAKGFPDIDNDFPVRDRKRVREYLKDRWDHDKVRTIGTTGRLKPKAAIDKTYKACSVTFAEADSLKKIVGETPDLEILGSDSVGWSRLSDPGKTVYVMEHMGEKIIEWLENQPSDRQDILFRWLELLDKVCGRVSGYGVHPSGVVVSDVSLADELPCMYNKSQEERVTCFPMDDVDKRQFVKQDLLGLRNLDTLNDWEEQVKDAYNALDEEGKQEMGKALSVLEEVERKAGIKWSGLDKLKHPDEMWKLLDDGYTRGIFQIEEGVGRPLCKGFKPRSIEDLAMVGTLIRPGPARARDPDTGKLAPKSFVDRRNGEEETTYDHPILEPLLNRTYGWFLYQEQVINFFTAIGYDLSDADAVRKMLGKKDPEAFQDLIHGNGEWDGKGYQKMAVPALGQAAADRIITKLEQFAKYSFNKSHSIAYAIIGFRTLYAKFYYPAEFLMASIRTIGDDPNRAKKTSGYISEARRMGIEVLPPDILVSSEAIAVHDGDIYFGFTQVAGIKAKATARYIMGLREKYDITSPEKLTDIVETENKVWEAEAKAARETGAAFKKKSPKQFLRSNQIAALFQAGAFDAYGQRDVPLLTKQKLEKELLGVILSDQSATAFDRSGHLIEEWMEDWDGIIDGFNVLRYPEPGLRVRVPGVISQIDPKVTRKDGKAMGIVTIEYEGHEAEFAVFPHPWRTYKFLWKERQAGLFELKCTDRGVHFEDGIALK